MLLKCFSYDSLASLSWALLCSTLKRALSAAIWPADVEPELFS
uniref:Uncharacterized protein n=1 Tax=Anguilla anguilla TaxID=7936 RepID=A0A0E9Y059_ANGAN